MSVNNTTYDAGVARLNSLVDGHQLRPASVLTAASDTSAPRDPPATDAATWWAGCPAATCWGMPPTSTGSLALAGEDRQRAAATYPIAATAGDVDGNGLTDLVLLSPRGTPSSCRARRRRPGGPAFAGQRVGGEPRPRRRRLHRGPPRRPDHPADRWHPVALPRRWLRWGGELTSHRHGMVGHDGDPCPGDFSGDGYPDLLARTATGDLLLYAGTPTAH